MSNAQATFAEVALSTGLRGTLSYAVSPELAETLEPGTRVLVPLGRREAAGYVVSLSRERPAFEKLRSIVRPDPPERLFSDQLLELTRWVADYYLAPWGQVLDGSVPANVRRSGTEGRRRKKDLPSETTGAIEEALPLFPAQEKARSEVAEALEAKRPGTFLLHGVTGSGKTEIYLRLADQVIRRGGQVLFLVPEIAMGAQIVERVRARFGPSVGLYHSQAGAGQRREVWNRARLGKLPIVVGARSAVFVPLPNLQLVIVDEEHESAYKQEETPRYHGRDVAVYRGHQQGAVVLLGSATPSLETHFNAQSKKYRLLQLLERIDGRPAPTVTVIDMTAEAEEGKAPPVFSAELITKIRDRMDRREQTILFLNRRGHSTTVQCADCGAALRCPACDVTLTFHQSDLRLRCHYCNATASEPDRCETCDSAHFFYSGYGTQKIEESLAELFPDARIVRMDRDATRRKGAHGDVVEKMEGGEIDILLGTQMVAKGFDFPKVTLVGVLQADQEILMPDFRASERGFQVLTQVAGRSGRGAVRGEVVFQTLMPESYVIQASSQEDYAAFAATELSMREDVGYPPFEHLIHVLVDGAKEAQVESRAEQLSESLTEWIEEHRIPARLVGPAPMSLSKLRGQYRWHLAVMGRSRNALHLVAKAALETKAPKGLSRTRIQVDVDPVSML